MNTGLRPSRNEDAAALHHIWKTVFGGGDEDLFFSSYYDPELCIVAEVNNTPAATGFILPVGNMVGGDRSVPCAMIYAVATLPEYRSRGFGKAIVNELISAGRAAGYPAIVLCPSEDSLFEYYSSRSELRDWFYTKEKTLDVPLSVESMAEINHGSSTAKLISLDVEDYACLRKDLLSATPHIESDIKALSYQNSLCSQYGGGMFRTETTEGISCVTIERQTDGSVWVKELLTPDDSSYYTETGTLTAIISKFPASRYVVRTPVKKEAAFGSPGSIGVSAYDDRTNDIFITRDSVVRRFGMLTSVPGISDIEYSKNALPWYGFAFD